MGSNGKGEGTRASGKIYGKVQLSINRVRFYIQYRQWKCQPSADDGQPITQYTRAKELCGKPGWEDWHDGCWPAFGIAYYKDNIRIKSDGGGRRPAVQTPMRRRSRLRGEPGSPGQPCGGLRVAVLGGAGHHSASRELVVCGCWSAAGGFDRRLCMIMSFIGYCVLGSRASRVRASARGRRERRGGIDDRAARRDQRPYQKSAARDTRPKAES